MQLDNSFVRCSDELPHLTLKVSNRSPHMNFSCYVSAVLKMNFAILPHISRCSTDVRKELNSAVERLNILSESGRYHKLFCTRFTRHTATIIA